MVNRVILLGNLGKDPEVKTLEGGNKVASFSMATSESYKNKQGEKVTNTEWHNISAWGGLADVVEKYLKKGNQVYIEGKIKTRSWTDKEDIKRYSVDIVANNLVMLGGNKEDKGVHEGTVEGEKDANNSTSKDSDDLPF